MLGVRDGFGQKRSDMIIMQRIDHLTPVTLADNQGEVAQHPKLLGHGGLSHPDLARELPDRTRPGTKATEYPHTARRRERLHRLRDRPRGLGGNEREIRL